MCSIAETSMPSCRGSATSPRGPAQPDHASAARRSATARARDSRRPLGQDAKLTLGDDAERPSASDEQIDQIHHGAAKYPAERLRKQRHR